MYTYIYIYIYIHTHIRTGYQRTIFCAKPDISCPMSFGTAALASPPGLRIYTYIHPYIYIYIHIYIYRDINLSREILSTEIGRTASPTIGRFLAVGEPDLPTYQESPCLKSRRSARNRQTTDTSNKHTAQRNKANTTQHDNTSNKHNLCVYIYIERERYILYIYIYIYSIYLSLYIYIYT